MTNPKHTPGPWHAEKVYGDWNVYDAEENLIAAVHSDEQPRADARLIAALPEMVAALKRIATLQGYATWTGKPEAYIAALADVARAAFPDAEER